MGTKKRTRPHPHMCPHMADMWPGNRPPPQNGQKWAQILPIFLASRRGGVPGGCTYCTSLRAMKGTYIGFQSMVVSILDHVF